MLQDNLKNQRDSVKNGLDTRRTGHVILHWEFLNENFIALSSRVLSFQRIFFLAKSVRPCKTLAQKFVSETNQANFKIQIEVYYKLTCISSLRLDFNIYSIIAIALRLIQGFF